METTRGNPALDRLVARAKDDPEALAVILFGSRARGDASPGSDFDVCLVLGSKPGPDLAAARKRLEYASEASLDLAIFQQLPLHIRSRVLKEGTVLFVRDEDALYDLAIRTARAFEDFRHIYRQYLDQVSRD
jgi:predicted nucleotidyltransferase